MDYYVYGEWSFLVEILLSWTAPLFLAAALLPFATFAVLFTSAGNVVRRALRKKDFRTVCQFNLRSLLVLVTFIPVSLAWLSALHEDGRAASFLTDWLLISIPLAFGLTVVRFFIDLWDDSRRPAPAEPPPTWTFDSPEVFQDSHSTGE